MPSHLAHLTRRPSLNGCYSATSIALKVIYTPAIRPRKTSLHYSYVVRNFAFHVSINAPNLFNDATASSPSDERFDCDI